MKYLLITADYNDADYITEMSYDPSDKDLNVVRKVIPILQTNKNQWNNMMEEYRTPDEIYTEMYKDVLSIEEMETFDKYVPKGEYGVHTIASVTIFEVSQKEELL